MPEWRNKLFIYAAMLFLLALPFGGHIASPILTVFALLWLIDSDWKSKFERIRKNRMLLLPALLYVFYLTGMLITENTKSGYAQLETKLTLILGPVIFSSIAFPEKFSKKKIFIAFITGCFIALLTCLAHSTYCFYDERWQVAHGLLADTYTNYNFFYASLLSWLVHPSYFAMFLCLCIFYIFTQIFNNSDGYSPLQIRLLLVLNIVFSFFIFFLASRLGLGVMLLIWFGVIVYFILWRKMYLRGVIIFSAILITFIFLYKTQPIIASRFDSVIETIRSKNIDKTTTESSSARRLIWGVASDIISENWLVGVGTGDVAPTLMSKYNEIGMTGAKEHNWNVHNQFLQTFMAIGLPGIVTLIAIFILPAYSAIKEKRYLFLAFLIIFGLNILVESMFEAEDGVLFFIFFYTVLQRLSVKNSLNS
ncbi:hypothetical protein BH09BAC5_BH09BAC5_07200 [soil metagenome]